MSTTILCSPPSLAPCFSEIFSVRRSLPARRVIYVKPNDERSALDLHMVHKKPNTVSFPTRFADYTAQHVPLMKEFSQLWSAWDMATHDMIPQEELLTKPIKLRNACIFYLGHIPCFADIHMTRATGSEPTSPASYQKIFERGIDPDVDNPEHCHAHR